MDNQPDNSLESLDAPETTQIVNGESSAAASPPPGKSTLPGKVKDILNHSSIYLLLFGLILIITAAVIIVTVTNGNKAAKKSTGTISTQNLDASTLDQLKNADVTLGDPKQILAIQSNAVFAGKVLVKGSLDVAGGVNIGNALALPGITVSGTGSFNQILANQLAISGTATIQGTLSVQKNLSVGGSASFGGTLSAPQLAVDVLTLNKDIQLNRHIDAGGSSPTKSDGSALGSGGTTSVSGSDTAGTIAINLGGSPAAGCFVTVNFAQKFTATPHVVVTPVGSDASTVAYYINRTATNFSLCTSSPGPAGKSFSFDYIAID